jgi:integral membrane sensor domain MASE1
VSTILLLAAACFAAAELAYQVTVASGGSTYTIVWIPLGFLTAALIASDRKRWPALAAAAAAGILVSGIGVHGHGWRSDAIACGITVLESLAAVLLVRRLTGGPFGDRFELTQVTHIWNLALVSTGVAAGGGLIAAFLLDAHDLPQLLVAWRAHGMAQLDGLLLATPAAIGVMQGPGVLSKGSHGSRRAEAAIAMAIALIATEMVFGELAPSMVRVPAYVLPVLLWIAFRCEAGDASFAMFAVCIIGVINTAAGRGPFTLVSPNASLDAWILRAQGAAVTSSLSIMLLAAVVAERRQAAIERDQLVQELQEALAQIKTLHGLIPLCAWCHKIRDDAGAWQGLETYLQDHTDATFSHGICPSCSLTMDAEHGDAVRTKTASS